MVLLGSMRFVGMRRFSWSGYVLVLTQYTKILNLTPHGIHVWPLTRPFQKRTTFLDCLQIPT